MASFSSSSSSSPLASQPLKYDVFLSFRGADTRRNFTSYLYDALCQKGLLTFFDDHELKGGEEIAQSLPQAIQDSTVAVVVFSKDYASSTWCLEELAEIIKCHQTHGQILIPAFYEVDPSHLRKQSHDVAAAFVKHKQNPKSVHKISRWRDALTTAAGLRGFDSKNFSNDRMLIEKIVDDILEKLNLSMTCDDFGHLVGMDSRIEEIKKVVTIKPLEIRVLGIWGMGGFGKTTIAEIIYNMMLHQFQSCCFIYDVRRRAEASGIMKLQEELISKALDEKELNAGPRSFLKRRLHRKRMLIVLDDVENPLQVESLIGDPCWFGLGSMILITSRDNQVFAGRADFIYEVKPLNFDEALQLFNESAFKQKYPKDDYISLSISMVKYAQGNPLALKVLGSSLIGKKKKEWESALNQLSEVPNKDIQSVLQISYEGLNRMEKEVFLDIACFFKHGRVHVHTNFMRQIYKNSIFNIDIILSVLIDKCLMTTSKYGMLEMHDLLQEMGKEIVRQEAKYPNRRSRLWDPKDIYEVFVENKEAEAVESIILDITKIKEIDLNPSVFMKMPNLRFLKFYRSFGEKSNLSVSQDLDYLPNKLRYFYWHGYPLESFPPMFQLENLVVLQLPNSKIKQFRKKKKEEAFRENGRILSIIVNSFCSLFKVPSFGYGILLGKLSFLSLTNNKSITHLPNSRSRLLEALEVLDLRHCSNLTTFPEISSNIEKLYLNWTAIEQVPPSSVELLGKLKVLEMMHCKELRSLPTNFFSKLTSLENLHLMGSSRLKELPEILEPMDNLEHLNLSKTAIQKLPSSIVNLKGLNHFDASQLNLKTYFIQDHLAQTLTMDDMPFLRWLSLFNCNLRELPENLSFLSSVGQLNLSGNDFERIPATIKQLSQLEFLYINNCNRLQSLPELPLSVSVLDAENCRSLEQIWALKQLSLNNRVLWKSFGLYNCLKLDENECQPVANALLRNYLSAFTRNQWQKISSTFHMGCPGSTIPNWVKYQSMGDSIQIYLPSHWFNHRFLGFAFYVCLDSVEWGFNLRYDCYFGDNYHFSSADSDFEPLYVPRIEKEHVIVFISDTFCEWVCEHGNSEEDVAFFKFSIDDVNGIRKCGVIPLYAPKDVGEFCETFDFQLEECAS